MDFSLTGEDTEVSSSTHFIPRRRPPAHQQHSSSSSNFHRSSNRPHSIGASIISNPKLVKGWQYYDNSPHQRDIKKYFSTVHIGGGGLSVEETFFLEQSETGTTKSGGSGGEDRNSFIQSNQQSVAQGGGDEVRDAYEPLDLQGIEIKACVAPEEKKDCTSVIVKLWSPILGIFLTLVASSCLALSTVLKETIPSSQYHPYMVLVWTSQGLFWPSFVLLLCPCQMRSVTLTKLEVPSSSTNNKFVTITLLLLRAVFGWLSAVLSSASLDHISVNHTAMVLWIAPVFVLLLAWILLREKSGWVPLITAIIVIVGVGGILQPPMFIGTGEGNLFIGLSFAGGAMITEGILSVLILRHLRHVHFALVTYIYGLVGMGGGVVLYYFYNDKFQLPIGGQDICLAVIICVLVFLGQTGITGALKYEQAGIFAVVSCWQVPMMVVWRYWFLDMSSNWISFFGTLLILFGVLILTARKLVENRPNSRRTRRWLGFLLA